MKLADIIHLETLSKLVKKKKKSGKPRNVIIDDGSSRLKVNSTDVI